MKISQIRNQLVAIVAAALLSMAVPLTANASDAYNSGDWEYSLDIYLWASGMKGSTNSGVNFDIDFDTVLDNLKMAFMGSFEARNNRYSIFTDIIYMNIGTSRSGTVVGDGPFGLYQDRKINIGLKSWVITLAGGYNLVDTEQHRLDIIAGTRYFSLREDLGLKIKIAGREVFNRSVSVSDDLWDAIVGVRGRVNIDDNWFLPYYIDIGAGGSDLTWQAMGGVGYGFDWGDLYLTYRHMGYDYDDDFINADIDMSGLLMGAKYRF